MKKIIALLTAAICTLALAACAASGTAEDITTAGAGASVPQNTADKQYRLAVLQEVTHPALDGAYAGFISALADGGIIEGQNLTIDFQNASGDKAVCQTVAAKFAGDNPDFVLAIATGAAQACRAAITDVPVFFTAVTDPVAAGLVNSNEAPGGNVTGTSDMNPVAEQAELLQKLAPNAKTVGLLFSAGEVNSRTQADLATAAFEKLGIKCVEYTVSQTSEIQSVVQGMTDKVDAVYIPTDNTMASNMATVSMILNDAKIPVICGESNMVNEGGLATYSVDYDDLGAQTAKMALRVLKEGADPATTPVETQTKFWFNYNARTADAIGITIPDELREQVDGIADGGGPAESLDEADTDNTVTDADTAAADADTTAADADTTAAA